MSKQRPEDFNFQMQMLNSILSLQATLLSIRSNFMEYKAEKNNQSILPTLENTLIATYFVIIATFVNLALVLYECDEIRKEENPNPTLIKANRTLLINRYLAIINAFILLRAVHYYIDAAKEIEDSGTSVSGVPVNV